MRDLKNETLTRQEPRRALQTGGGSTIKGYLKNFKELRINCCQCGSLQETLQVLSLLMMHHLSLSPSATPADPLPSTARNPDCFPQVPRAPAQFWIDAPVTQSCGESHTSNCSQATQKPQPDPGLKKLLLTTFKHLQGMLFLQGNA